MHQMDFDRIVTDVSAERMQQLKSGWSTLKRTPSNAYGHKCTENINKCDINI